MQSDVCVAQKRVNYATLLEGAGMQINEAAFFKLIHNTFLSKHKSDLLGIEDMPITGIYE